MTVEEYEKLLIAHDWYYDYSDDHQVYIKGSENKQLLFNLSNTNAKFKELWNAYHDKYFKETV